jgi:hypothetical protein
VHKDVEPEVARHGDGLVVAGIVHHNHVVHQPSVYLVVGLGQRFFGIVSGHHDNDFFCSIHLQVPCVSADRVVKIQQFPTTSSVTPRDSRILTMMA